MIEEPFFELTVEQKNKMAQGAVVFRFFSSLMEIGVLAFPKL